MWLQLLIIFISFVGLSFYDTSRSRNPAKTHLKYIILVFTLLAIQSGFRNLAVGDDTYAYFQLFGRITETSWSDIFRSFHDYYVDGIGKDPGYPLFEKIFQIFSTDFTVYLCFVAVVYFSALGYTVRKSTTDNYQVFLVVCLYQVLFYGFTSITGIRQTLALSLTLLSYKFIRERKLLPFVVLVLAAATIHKSALIFLPFYFIARISKSKFVIVLSLCTLPLFFMYARNIVFFMVEQVDAYESYAQSTYETEGAVNYLAFVILFVIMTMANYKRLIAIGGKQMHAYINALGFTLALAPLAWVDPSLIRVSYYFSFFMLMLFPNLVAVFTRNTGHSFKLLVTLVIVIAFCAVIIRRGAVYGFFWEKMSLNDVYYLL